MKQWELKNNSKVDIGDGKIATFLEMDGMYARWDLDGELKIGNFDEFEETKDGYRVIPEKELEEMREEVEKKIQEEEKNRTAEEIQKMKEDMNYELIEQLYFD